MKSSVSKILTLGKNNYKLDVDLDYDFVLVGILSILKEHVLAWNINKCLDIDLHKSEDLKINFSNDAYLLISNYIFEQEYFIFRLLKNKADYAANIRSIYLLPELKHYDYFILLSGHYHDYIDNYVKCLKKIEGINLNQTIPLNKIKNKDHLFLN